MLVTQYLMLNSLFQSWKGWSWEPFQNFGVATNSHSFPLHCSEGASSAPDNVLNKCPSMQQGDLGQNPALNRIQWDPSPLHRLWHCQWMHTCCYTLSQSAQSLGQKGRSAKAGTAWIFSFCSPVRAPLLLLPIPSAPLVPLCSTEGRRVVGTCPLLPGVLSDREDHKEILLYWEQESKGAERH